MKKFLTSITSLTILCSVAPAQDLEKQPDRPTAQRTVERGNFTRDHRNAKDAGMRKNHPLRDTWNRGQTHARPDLPRQARLQMLLGRLVGSGQISQEVSAQIMGLALEGGRPGPGPRPHEHFEKLTGDLERLIDRARHELEEIKETREHLNRGHHERGERDERNTPEQRREHAHGEAARAEAMERMQLEMRKRAEMNVREMQKRRMMEERKKREAAARERVGKKKQEEKRDNDKKREAEKRKEQR